MSSAFLPVSSPQEQSLSQKLPLVSVVIPTFNRAWCLGRAVESVLAQTYRPLELIVVDDGSTDETSQLITKYPLRYVRLPRNYGVSFARNRGLFHSKGEFIAFLDSDDYYLPTKVEEQVKFLLVNRSFYAVQSEEVWVRRGRRANPRLKHAKARGYFLDRALELCVVSPSSVMLRREVFDEMGLFDPEFSVCEDYDLFIRFALRYPMGYQPLYLVVKDGGREDQLSARRGLDFFRLKSLIKNYLQHQSQLKPEEGLLFLYQIRKKAEIFSQGARKRGNLSRLFEVETLLRLLRNSSKALPSHETDKGTILNS